MQAQNEVSKYAGIVNESERIIAKHERVTKGCETEDRLVSFCKRREISGTGDFISAIWKISAYRFFNNTVDNLLLQFSEENIL
ncbi:MAG: hypothetical protein MZV64_61775 [Ignavibacteriales bacterium]|nr:hypothetical protein [Ignavibacteriales bacterium]